MSQGSPLTRENGSEAARIVERANMMTTKGYLSALVAFMVGAIVLILVFSLAGLALSSPARTALLAFCTAKRAAEQVEPIPAGKEPAGQGIP